MKRTIELQGGPFDGVTISVPTEHGIGEIVLRSPHFPSGSDVSNGFVSETYAIFDGAENAESVTDFAMHSGTSKEIGGLEAYDEVEPAPACESCEALAQSFTGSTN